MSAPSQGAAEAGEAGNAPAAPVRAPGKPAFSKISIRVLNGFDEGYTRVSPLHGLCMGSEWTQKGLNKSFPDPTP